MFRVKDGIQIGSAGFVDGSRNITAVAINHTGDITMTAAEGREIKTYMPSSYTTGDLVSGHEYGWYNDHWRVGMTRSGNSAGDDFVVQFNGVRKFDISTSGYVTAVGDITAFSDERLKSDIHDLDGSKVLQMRGVSFVKDGKAGSGVIAQELEQVAPELVYDGEYKSVAYGNIVGYLIEAIKMQQKQIDELKLKLEK